MKREKILNTKEKRCFKELKAIKDLARNRATKLGGTIAVPVATSFSHTGHIGSSDLDLTRRNS